MKMEKQPVSAAKACFSLARAVFLFCFVTVGILAVFLIILAYRVTKAQYEETLVWENTAYSAPLAEIEPVLVSNIVDTGIVSAASAWERLDAYVEALPEGIPDRAEAEEILADAVAWQAAYGLDSDSIDRLRLYLNLEDAMAEAYETLDTGALEELTMELSELEGKEETSSGQYYLGRVRQVYDDFVSAEILMEDVVGSTGSFEGGVWTLPSSATAEDLNQIASDLTALDKFPSICSTDDLSWQLTEVLRYNENTADYVSYHRFLNIMKETSRSDYIPVSSIQTYGDALAFGCNVSLQEREGFTVSPQSPVESFSYRGNAVEEGSYVRMGASLTARIEERYDPVLDNSPEEEEDTQILENQEPLQGNQNPSGGNTLQQTPSEGDTSQENQNPSGGNTSQGNQNPSQDNPSGEFNLDNTESEDENNGGISE